MQQASNKELLLQVAEEQDTEKIPKKLKDFLEMMLVGKLHHHLLLKKHHLQERRKLQVEHQHILLRIQVLLVLQMLYHTIILIQRQVIMELHEEMMDGQMVVREVDGGEE